MNNCERPVLRQMPETYPYWTIRCRGVQVSDPLPLNCFRRWAYAVKNMGRCHPGSY